MNGAWTTAETVPAPVSTDAREAYPTVVGDGSLYFTSGWPGGAGSSSAYRAQRRADGSFAPPVLVPPPINGEFGVGDSLISFRRADGVWGEPVHLGDTVNTDKTDFCPFVTPDGKYFFFSRVIPWTGR